MQKSYGKELATHTDPESCGVTCKGDVEALTGDCETMISTPTVMTKFEALRPIAMLGAQADKPVGMYDTLKPMRSGTLVVARPAQGPQPVHDVYDSRFHHFRILCILCQRTIAFDHRDQ